METYQSSGVTDTEKIAYAFAERLRPGDVVAYYGDLGAGKTAFTRGVVRRLAPDAQVTSPTFTFMNQYVGNLTVNHFDMYRISGFDDLYGIGFFDCLDGKSVTLIEWSENIEFALPEDAYTVRISQGENPNDRRIEIGRRGET